MKDIFNIKYDLIILSLAPLFLLVGIKNYIFSLDPSKKNYLFNNPLPIIVVLILCVVWVVASIIILLRFKYAQTYDYRGGYSVKDVHVESEVGLNFFLTYILPFVFDGLDRWQNAITFLIMVMMLFILMSKTNLYYANPLLTVLGYKVIRFKFEQPPTEELNDEVIGVSPRNIDINRTIKYKIIEGKVLYIKQKRYNNSEQRRTESENS